MILEFDSLVDGDVILDPATVPDPDVVADVHILAEGTVLPDDSAALDMAEVPNLRPGADGYPIVDITAFVNEKVFHPGRAV